MEEILSHYLVQENKNQYFQVHKGVLSIIIISKKVNIKTLSQIYYFLFCSVLY
jgi:hypothetical protein